MKSIDDRVPGIWAKDDTTTCLPAGVSLPTGVLLENPLEATSEPTPNQTIPPTDTRHTTKVRIAKVSVEITGKSRVQSSAGNIAEATKVTALTSERAGW
ncbi:hypothetical protein [Neomicrococcus lactis]|uniref:hypothetical protein n=1 Tax=Neomicrococcus lactis TaxID=732241 RepID=UPI00230162F6|nr:hypothetical protein [Neomicrococcus lactis]